jgi:hypothetical protein
VKAYLRDVSVNVFINIKADLSIGFNVLILKIGARGFEAPTSRSQTPATFKSCEMPAIDRRHSAWRTIFFAGSGCGWSAEMSSVKQEEAQQHRKNFAIGLAIIGGLISLASFSSTYSINLESFKDWDRLSLLTIIARSILGNSQSIMMALPFDLTLWGINGNHFNSRYTD